MRFILLVVACLALSACQPHNTQGRAPSIAGENAGAGVVLPEHAPPTPVGGSPDTKFADAFEAKGTEPFWALKIEREGLTLERPDQATLTIANPRVNETGKTTVWSSIAKNQAVVVTLHDDGDCSDGMSDRVYRYSAVVVVGSESLRGCAFKVTTPAQSANSAR